MSSIPLGRLTRSELRVLDTVTQMDVTSHDPAEVPADRTGPNTVACLPFLVGLRYYSRLAGVIPRWSTGMWGHGIAPGHENQCLLSGETVTDTLLRINEIQLV